MDYVASFFPNERFVSIGGSIARGTADQYSDVDLTIYNHLKVTDDQNVEYRDIIIQIHFSSLPRIRSVCKDPWANRFLSEIRVLRDKDNLLRNIHQEACTFLNSSSAQKKMIYTVQEIVQHRILAAKRFYQIGRFYSATNAAMGSWSEAAFLYLYLAEGSVSTSRLIPCIRKDQHLYHAFRTHGSICECQKGTDFSPMLHRLRTYLRAQKVEAPFDLDPLQEQLVEQKNKRYIQSGDCFNLQWQMYGEALWLFFCLDDSLPFEYYYGQLPSALQKGLRQIGFVPLEKCGFDALCRLSIEMIEKMV